VILQNRHEVLMHYVAVLRDVAPLSYLTSAHLRRHQDRRRSSCWTDAVMASEWTQQRKVFCLA
jgi:hypothetical protein